MKKKGLTYEELISLAEEYYNRGGDAIVECWDKKTFDYYVKEFGPMTKKDALDFFRIEYSQEKEMENLSRGQW